ncbi:MAG: glycine cleavage system protein H [Desulfobacteraceae bacterium]
MDSTCSMNVSAEEGHPCIWMQAGVVSRKLCHIRYDCPSCRFDRILRRVSDENLNLKREGLVPKGKRGLIVSWQQKLRSQPATKRPCIHHMRGRIEFKICTNDYKCANCEFDQYFNDQYSVHAVMSPVDVLDVEGFKVPQGYYFHPGHTWIKVEEDSLVRVGIDEFALRLLGPLDRIEAPLMGKEVKQGGADIGVSRVANQARFLSPVSGVVTAINPKLRDEGELANQDPYSTGWVMSVHCNNLREELKNLMINNETEGFLEGEVARLYELIEEVAGPLAADGGDLSHDIYGHMPQLGWERITKTFLKT